jgi:hypothetical protein
MWRQMTFEDLGAATSSPESAGGPTPCGSPGGPTTDLFGPAPAPANPSQPPVGARRPMTNATCGLAGHLSSASAALEQSLVSRLKRHLDGAGSTLFSLIWRRKATPAGRPYYQLAASGRRTSETGFGSWAPPAAQEAGGTAEQFLARKVKARANGAELGVSLTSLSLQAQLAGWTTPTARDGRSEYGTPEMMARRAERPQGKPLSEQVLGPTPSGYPAQTEKRGQLSPDFSRWLMGYSADHLSCAPTAMPSYRKSRPSS